MLLAQYRFKIKENVMVCLKAMAGGCLEKFDCTDDTEN